MSFAVLSAFGHNYTNKFCSHCSVIKNDKGVICPASQVKQNKRLGENVNQAQSVHTHAVWSGKICDNTCAGATWLDVFTSFEIQYSMKLLNKSLSKDTFI